MNEDSYVHGIFKEMFLKEFNNKMKTGKFILGSNENWEESEDEKTEKWEGGGRERESIKTNNRYIFE